VRWQYRSLVRVKECPASVRFYSLYSDQQVKRRPLVFRYGPNVPLVKIAQFGFNRLNDLRVVELAYVPQPHLHVVLERVHERRVVPGTCKVVYAGEHNGKLLWW